MKKLKNLIASLLLLAGLAAGIAAESLKPEEIIAKHPGMTLPHQYKIRFVSNSNTASNENIWGVTVSEYRFNQALKADFFTFDTK